MKTQNKEAMTEAGNTVRGEKMGYIKELKQFGVPKRNAWQVL